MALRNPRIAPNDMVIGGFSDQQALQIQGDLVITNAAGTVIATHDVSVPSLTFVGAVLSGQYVRTVAKTTNYTVLVTDSGTFFTTTGAGGAVTFTLPALTAGFTATFMNTVDQNMAITAPSAILVAKNSATSTTATWSTASEKIGAIATVVCDGTNYFLLDHGAEAFTFTLS